MTTFYSDIRPLLAQVGIEEQENEAELIPGITAKTYRSAYARLYVADCANTKIEDWSDAIRRIDRRVLQDIRASELSDGGVVDAHICFVIQEDSDPTSWIQQNEQLVRHVSRKYWIKQSKLGTELGNRLTLLPITGAPSLQQTDNLDLSTADKNWLDRLVSDGPTMLSTDFLSHLENFQ
jgi:hypothetical protein